MPAAPRRGRSRPSAVEDRPLVLRPAERVLPDRAVRPDDAVARHDERHRVVSERGPDGADRLGPADLGGDPAVRPDLAARDLERLVPDVALEVGVAAQVEVDPHPAIAGEPAGDRRGQPIGQPVGADARAGRSGRGGPPRTRRRRRPPRRSTRPARSRPPRAARSGSRTARTGRPARPRRGRSGRAWPGRVVAEAGHGRLEVAIVGGHAVISSRSRRWAASNAVRNRARPRWTWALTVPSGRSRAVASSG